MSETLWQSQLDVLLRAAEKEPRAVSHRKPLHLPFRAKI